MKSNVSIAVWMTVVSVLLKMLIFYNNLQFTNLERVAIFGNVFVLMTGVFLGIRLFKKETTLITSLLTDIKAGLRVAALYAIFMCAFVYFYYTFIDATYFTEKLLSQLEIAKQNNLDLKNVEAMGKFVLTPFFQSTITLIGFLLLGSFYASIIAFLMRKVSGFNS